MKIPKKSILNKGSRMWGILDPRDSSMTLAWLATHRNRLHSLILGGKRLSVLVIWDSKGSQSVEHSKKEVEALSIIVDGDPFN